MASDYEYKEIVYDLIHRSQVKQLGNTLELAVASAHGLAFHRGLGEPVHPTSSTPLNKYLSHEAIGAFSTLAYRKSNIAIVANGADQSELNKWVGQYFKDMRTTAAQGIPPMESSQTKYFGGEERIAHGSGNSMVLAFPGSSSLTGGFYKPEISVLASLLGGKSAIKWSPGFSLLGKLAEQTPGLHIDTHSAIYSDAGLIYITFNGPATAVREAAAESVKILKNIAEGKIGSEEFKKARATAKFKELEYGQEMMAGLELTGSGLVHDGKPYQLDDSAKAIGEVTEEKLKEVRNYKLMRSRRAFANVVIRLQRVFWTSRRVSRLLEIYFSFHMPQTSDCTYRWLDWCTAKSVVHRASEVTCSYDLGVLFACVPDLKLKLCPQQLSTLVDVDDRAPQERASGKIMRSRDLVLRQGFGIHWSGTVTSA